MVLLLLILLLGLMMARRLYRYDLATESGINTTHITEQVDYFRSFDLGNYYGRRPGLAGVGIKLDSPLYFWMHLPIRLFENPFSGLRWLDLLLEAGGILFWVLWGLRRGLPPPLVWLSALFLVCMSNPSAELLENGQTANLMVVPLAMALIGGVSSTRGRSMLLPGLLWSMTLQVQLAYAVLGLPMVIAVLLYRGARVRRLLFLFLGAGLAYLWALPMVELPGQAQAGQASGLLDHLNADNLDYVASRHAPGVLALMGLVLVMAHWILRRRAGPGPGVAAIWLLLCWPVMVVAVATLLPRFGTADSPVRFGVLLPAQALLSAATVLWLGWLLERLLLRALRQRWSRLATPLAGAAVLAACAVLLIKPALGENPGRLTDTWSGPGSSPCCLRMFACHTVRRWKTHNHLAEAMLRTDWGADRNQLVKFHGPADTFLDTVHIMLSYSVRSAETLQVPLLSRDVLALPCSMGKDLPGVKARCEPGSVLLIADVKDLVVEQDPSWTRHEAPRLWAPERGAFSFTADPAGHERRLFAVTWKSRKFDRRTSPGAGVVLRHQGRELETVSRCFCREDFTSEVVVVELKVQPGRSAKIDGTATRQRGSHSPSSHIGRDEEWVDVVEILPRALQRHELPTTFRHKPRAIPPTSCPERGGPTREKPPPLPHY